MKKQLGSLIVGVLLAGSLWAENADLTTTLTGPAATVLTVAVKANQVLSFPMTFKYVGAGGMQLSPADKETFKVDNRGLKPAPSALSTLVAQVGGVWYSYVIVGKKLTKSQVALVEDWVVNPSISLGAGSLKARSTNFAINATVDVVSGKGVTVPANADSATVDSVDPLKLDARTFYLLTSDFKNGLKVTLSPWYTFEVGNSLFTDKSGDAIRQTLLYWVLNLKSAVNEASYKAKMPAFDSSLFAALQAADPTATGPLKVSVISLLKNQLGLDSSSSGQSWRFPQAELYSDETPTRYPKLFFQILERFTMVTEFGDTSSNGKWKLPDGAALAERAKEYLFGVVEGKPVPAGLQSQYELIKTNAPGASFEPRTTLASVGVTIPTGLSGTGLAPYGSSSWALTSPLSDKQTDFASALVVVPPGQNLLGPSTLSAASFTAAQALLSAVAVPKDLTLANNQLVLSFSSPQTVRSLVAWLGPGTTFQKVEYQDATTKLYATAAAAVYAVRKGTASYGLEVRDPANAAENLVAAVDFGAVQSISGIRITLAGKGLWNLRAYQEAFDLVAQGKNTTWTVNSAAHRLDLQSSVSRGWPEVFTTQGGNDFLYFTQSGNLVVAGAAKPLPDNYAPIRFAAGGLDTPFTYNLKVLNNLYWKNTYSLSKSPFALSELDLTTTPAALSDGYLYKGSAAPPTALKNPNLNGTVYPYGYGTTLSTKSGMVTDSRSPFFVEKLAGVDSPQMLLSLLKTLNYGTRTNAFLAQRFDRRTKLQKYDTIINPTTWAGDDQKVPFVLQSDWFLQNSYVLTDLSKVAPGDILVGYEGSELNAAIVIQSHADADLAAAQKSIEVIAINRGLQRAVYTTWQAMSLNPDQYHVRRLIVSPDNADQTPQPIGGFLNVQPQLTYSFEGSDLFGNWIPNTGEPLSLGRIVLKGDAPAEVLDGKFWTVAAAWDYYGDQVGEGNITVNSEGTIFHLVASLATQKENGIPLTVQNGLITGPGLQDVAQFKKRIGVPALDIEYGKGEGELVMEDSHLAWRKDKTSTPYSYFSIVATSSTGAVKPGDDLGLSFQVKGTALGTLTTKAEAAPRIAAYDKKLLWRANLYIDEGANQRGADGQWMDWNDRHPWVGSASNPNDWNTPPVGYQGIPGGQVVEIPLTKWSSGAYGHEIKKIQFAVSYDHQGWDTPFSYLDKLKQQAQLLNQWYTKFGFPFQKPAYLWKTGSPDTWPKPVLELFLSDEQWRMKEMKSYLPSLDAYQKESKYQALKATYINLRDNASQRWGGSVSELKRADLRFKDLDYAKMVFSSDYGMNITPYKTNGTGGGQQGGGDVFTPFFHPDVRKNVQVTAGSEKVTLTSGDIYPYIPGLSDSIMMNRDFSTYPDWLVGARSAGVDCNGLVQISHAWNNSPYSAINDKQFRRSPIYWTATAEMVPKSAMLQFSSTVNASEIVNVDSGDSQKINNVEYVFYDQFKYLIPGDVVARDGHIMMVLQVKTPSGPGGRYLDKDVVLVESVFNSQDISGYWGAVVGRPLSNETNAEKVWHIWRQK